MDMSDSAVEDSVARFVVLAVEGFAAVGMGAAKGRGVELLDGRFGRKRMLNVALGHATIIAPGPRRSGAGSARWRPGPGRSPPPAGRPGRPRRPARRHRAPPRRRLPGRPRPRHVDGARPSTRATSSAGSRRWPRSVRAARASPTSPWARYRASQRWAVRCGTPASREARASGTPSCRCSRSTRCLWIQRRRGRSPPPVSVQPPPRRQDDLSDCPTGFRRGPPSMPAGNPIPPGRPRFA